MLPPQPLQYKVWQQLPSSCWGNGSLGKAASLCPGAMEPESYSTDAAPAAGASGTREQMNKLPGVAAVVITSGPTRGERIS